MNKQSISIALFLGISTLAFGGGDTIPLPDKEPEKIAVDTDLLDKAFYLGLGYSYLSSKYSAVPYISGVGGKIADNKTSGNGLMIRAGYRLNSYLALEGRYGLSLGDQSLTDNLNGGFKEDVGIDISNFALYLKPMYAIDDLLLYGMLGYGKTRRDYGSNNIEWSNDGFQWGLGLQYSVGEHLSIFTDYAKWYNKKNEKEPSASSIIDTDFSAISTGISYKF